MKENKITFNCLLCGNTNAKAILATLTQFHEMVCDECGERHILQIEMKPVVTYIDLTGDEE